MKLKVKHPKLKPQELPELMELAELVGEFIEYWGFKRIHGRMWCLLYLSSVPLSSIELSQLLGVSPALITQSVQVLLSYRVILSVEKGKNGLLRYSANPDVAQAIGHVLAERELSLMNRIAEGHARLRAAKPSAHLDASLQLDSVNVDQMGDWIKLARRLLILGNRTLASTKNPFRAPKKYLRPEI